MGRLVRLGLAVVVLLCAPAASAWASEFSFDATLSLTGNCVTSSADSVPDPGLCPMPPGVAGVDHPALPFTRPEGVATDGFGDIYVSSYGKSSEGGKEGRIDIFSPSGNFISELKDGDGPRAITVDPQGELYIYDAPGVFPGLPQIQRCAPSTYEPASEEILYTTCTVAVAYHTLPDALPCLSGSPLAQAVNTYTFTMKPT